MIEIDSRSVDLYVVDSITDNYIRPKVYLQVESTSKKIVACAVEVEEINSDISE